MALDSSRPSVTTTDAIIATNNLKSRNMKVLINNLTGVTIYFGDSTITTAGANAVSLITGSSLDFTLGPTESLYCVSSSGTVTPEVLTNHII